MTAQRERYWDIIKGIAIMLMVFGHCIEYGSGAEYRESLQYFDSRVFQFIYSFHMPLFIFVSGYFFYYSINSKSLKKLASQKLKGLLVPVLSFSLITFFLFRFDARSGIISSAASFANTFVNSLWFLWSILICCTVVTLVKTEGKDNALWYIPVIIASLFIKQEWFSVHVYMLPYFILGYLINKFCLMQRLYDNDLIVLIVSSIVFALSFIIYNRDVLVYTSHTFLLSDMGIMKQAGIDTFRWIIGFAGIMTVLSLVRVIMRLTPFSGKGLSLCGVDSMGIYWFNAFLCAVYFHFTKSIMTPSFLNWVIAFICMLAASIVATEICKRIRICRFLVLGGR